MLIFKAHSKPITAIAFSPDGVLLATASGTERVVRLWQLGSDKPKKHPGSYRSSSTSNR